MNSLISTAEVKTMSSREIAELTGKEHDNVRRDISKMAHDLSLTFEEKIMPSNGGRPTRFAHTMKTNLVMRKVTTRRIWAPVFAGAKT